MSNGGSILIPNQITEDEFKRFKTVENNILS